ncbi:hypothetical protein Pse7367_0819 [Thalassoporum mexicanum PCC 7367]|uniref:ABC transporter permease n=1 Tax=Thalassoporum mexicanum TaxID=3457544 RepID=UPI00029F83E2|nr:ABC transporter permease [Pseudanabaena sp. PCC 7367]AFY69119.1 hypothetical protein Pse7367_0819 [Pseudanabaena sp. PCC 7367]
MWQTVFQVELEKLFRRSLLIALLAVIAGTTCLVFLGGYGLSQSVENDAPEVGSTIFQVLGWPGGIETALRVAAIMGNLAVIIATATIIGSEYHWRTVQLWVSQGIDRTTMLIARLSTILIPAVLFVALPLLIGLVFVTTLDFPNQATAVAGTLDLSQLLVNVWRVLLGIIFHAALALFMAVATRRVAGAISLSLVYKFFAEGFILAFGVFEDGRVAGWVKFLPMRAADALLVPIDKVVSNPQDNPLTVADILGNINLDPTPAAICVVIYTILLVTGAVLIFRNQDLAT